MKIRDANKNKDMEDYRTIIESLFDRVVEYTKTSFELNKLKAFEKVLNVISSFISHSVVFVFICSFLLFINLGIAFWLGGIVGNLSYGFFAIGLLNGIVGIVIYLFMRKWIKRIVSNYIIKRALN